MKKSIILIFCVICVSSVGIVFAIAPETLFVSTLSGFITPITNTIFPITPGDSSSVTTTITPSATTITPSSTIILQQTQSGISTISNTQASGVTASQTTITPTFNTSTPQTGIGKNNGGVALTTITVPPTARTITTIVGGGPGSSVLSITSNISPTSTIQVQTSTDASVSKTNTNLGVSGNAPTVNSATTTSSSVSPGSTTIVPTSTTVLPTTSTSSNTSTTLVRTSSNISGSNTTITPTTSTPTSNTTIIARTSTVTSPTISAAPGQVSRTTGQISGSILSSTPSKNTGTIVGTQISVGVGLPSGSTSNTISKTTGLIIGISKGSGTDDVETLSKTSGSISGTLVDLSGSFAPTSSLKKTSSSISGTVSGPIISKIISKTTGGIKGCTTDETCLAETSSISENLIAYKILDGPSIRSTIFSDNDLDSTVSEGDTMTITFDQSTNKPSVTNKSEINAIFDFSESIGFQYSGIWQTPSKLIITLDDVSNSQLTNANSGTSFSINNAGELRNSENTSLNSDSSGIIVVEFNQKSGPSILSFVANDPEEDDSGISIGDTLTIKFAEPTDRAGFDGTLNHNEINSMFTFSGNTVLVSPIGTSYTGQWQSNSTFIITLEDIFGTDLKIETEDVEGTTATVTGAIKNSDGTSLDSDSISPELSGSFGEFTTTSTVVEGGSVSTDLPSGTIAEIQLPEGDSGSITVSTADAELEGDAFSISAIGDIVEFDPTNGTSCTDGCTISFSFTIDEVPNGFDPFEMQILHDGNDDGDFDDDGEQLDTTVAEITTGFYTATAESNFTSKFAVGGVKALVIASLIGGGGSGFSFITINDGWGKIISDDGTEGILEKANLDLLEDSLKLESEDTLELSFEIYEYQGINNVEHVTLYLDDTGIDKLRDSKTFLRYEPYKSDAIQVSNTDGKISSVNLEIEEVDAYNFVFDFEIKFAKRIGESDVLLQVWNMDRRSHEIFYPEIFEVNIPEEIVQMDTEPLTESEINSEIHVPNWVKSTAKWWSTEKITDDEFVKAVEFLISQGIIRIPETQLETDQEANEIPVWIKNNAGWWAEGLISNNEFIDAIQYIVQKNIIKI